MPTFGDMRGNIRVVQSPSAKLQAIRLGGGQPSNTGGYMPGNFGGGLQLPQGFGGSNAYNIQNMYAAQNQLANHYQQLQAQQEAQNQQRQFSMSGGFDPGPTRQMTAVERGLKKGSDFTQGLVNATGWDPSKGFTLGNIMRFGASLPFQMAQGVTEGSEQLYEAATGRPLLQADSETGLIGTNILDASQRTASLANAGINIGGLFFGGSARAVGTGMNILSKGKAGARMAEGMFGRAMKSPVGQIGFDVAEEGGEEFVQQYLDDTRMKNLDGGTFGRAIEGAKWGALGGGMMSGGSLALRKGISGLKASKNQVTGENVADDDFSDSSKVSWTQSGPDDFAALQQSGGDWWHHTETAKAVNQDIAGPNRRRAASVSVKMSYSDNTLKKHQIRPGAGAVRAMWLDGRDSQAELMRAFKTTDENLMRSAILENTVDGVQYDSRAKALDALKQKTLGDERLIIGVGRNPDTQNGGFYMEVVGFNEGDGMDIHPWVAPLVGADYDGDTATMYWNTDDVNFNGFPVEMMRNPEGAPTAKGASYADWHYAFIEKGLANKRDEVRSKIKNVILPYYSKAGISEEEADKKIDQWTDKFIEYNSITEDKNVQASGYAGLFTEINDDIRGITGDRFDGITAVDDVMSSFESGIKERVEDIFHVVPETHQEVGELYGTEEEVDKFIKDYGLEPILNRGSIGSNMSKPVQIYAFIGGISYAITGKGNPFFRQYSMFSFNVHDHRMWVDDLEKFANLTKDESAFQTLMRAAFKLTALGEDPLEAIEGLIQSTAVARTMADFNKKSSGRKIRSQKDLDEFCDIYIAHYNELCEIYKGAKDAQTQRGIEVPANEFLDSPISGREDPAFFKKFRRSFGRTPLSQIFDKAYIAESASMMTVDEYATQQANDWDASYTAFIMMEDSSIQQFMNNIVKSKINEKNGLHTSQDTLFEESCPDGLLDHIKINDDGNVTLDTRYHASYFAYIDGVIQIVGVKNAIRAGLYGLEILGTRLGQALVNKSADVRKNAAICISLRAQYDEAVKLFNSEILEEKQLGEYMLDELSHIGMLHAIISEDIKHGGNFLDALTSLDVSLAEKESAIKTLSERMGNENCHIYDLFQDETGDMALASMSERVKKADKCMTRAKKALMIDEMDQARQIQDCLYGKIPGGDHRIMMPQYFVRLLNRSVSRINVDLIGAEIYDSTTLSNAAKEKSRQFAAGTQTWSTMELAENGGYLSFTDKHFSLANGVIDLEDFVQNRIIFLKCLSDPTFSIRVVDHRTGRSNWMSRDAIIKASGGDPESGWTPSNIVAVTQAFPQVIGWISESSIDPVTTAEGMNTARHTQNKSFMEGYRDYLDARKTVKPGEVDPSFEDQVEELKEALEIELLNETWYRSYLTRCIRSIDEKLTLPELVREARKLHRQAVDGFFSLAVAGEDTTPFKTLNETFLINLINGEVGEALDYLEFVNDQLSGFLSERDTNGTFGYTVSNIMSHATIAYELQRQAAALGIDGAGKIRIFDGFEDNADTAVQGMSDVVYSSIQQQYENTRTLIGLFALALGKEADISFDLSPDSKARFESWIDDIDVSGVDNGEGKKNQLRGFFENLCEETSSVFNFGDPDPNILTAADETVDATTDLVVLRKTWSKKVHGIQVASRVMLDRNESGEAMLDPAVEKQLDDIFFDESETDPQKRAVAISRQLHALRIVYNNQYLSYKLKELSHISGVRVNPNAYYSQVQFIEAYQKFVNGDIKGGGGLLPLRSRIEERTGKSLSSAEWESYLDKTPPIPSFFSPTAEAICGQLFNEDNSGFVEPAVSVNGAKTKQMYGFGYLPSDRIGEVEPDDITFDELKELYLETGRDTHRHHVILADIPLEFKNLSTVAALYEQYQFADDETKASLKIKYFDPEKNPHGISDAHTPAPYSLKHTGYKRFRGILGRIIDDSQEGQVLKAKKNLKFGGKIAIKWVDNNYHVEGDSVKKIAKVNTQGEFDSLFIELNSIMDSYRSEFKSGLLKLFDGELADLGYGYEEATILVQGLTPGFIITVEGPGGEISYHVLDVSHLYNQTTFEQRMAKISESGSVTSVEVLSVSPAEASSKIGRAVTAKSRQNPDATVGQMHDTAYKAMNNWDDYEIGTLPIAEIMSEMSSVAYSGYSPLVAADWRTKMMYVLDEINESKGWGSPRLDVMSRDKNVEPATEYIYPPMRVAIEHGNDIYIKRDGENKSLRTPVMKAFLPKQTILQGVGWKGKFNEVFQYAAGDGPAPAKTPEGKIIQMQGMSCICADAESVSNAIKWGEQTGGIVYFTEEVWNKTFVNTPYVRKRGVAYTKVAGQEIKMIMTLPGRDWHYRREESVRPRATRKRLPKKEIKATFHDVAGDYEIGDGALWFLQPMLTWSRLVTGGVGVKLSNLFQNVNASGDISIASKAYVIEVLDAYLNDGDTSKLDLTSLRAQDMSIPTDEDLRVILSEYRSRLSRNKDLDSVLKRDVSSNTLVGFVRYGDAIAPIFTPPNSPKNIRVLNMVISLQDSELQLLYDGKAGIDSQDSTIKTAEQNAPGMKMTGTPAKLNPNDCPYLPNINDMNSQGDMVDMILDQSTEGSRIEGFEDETFARDVWYALRWMGGSLLYERGAGNTGYRVRTDIANVNPTDLMSSFYIDATHGAIMAGTANLVTERDGYTADEIEKMNAAIRKVLWNCRLFRININEVFSTYNLEHGTGEDFDKLYAVDNEFDTEYMMVFDGMGREEICWFAHAMNPKLIPMPGRRADGSTLMDTRGHTRVFIKGNPEYHIVRWGDSMDIGDESSLFTPTGSARYAPQHMYRRAADIGYAGDVDEKFMDTEWADAIEYADYLIGNHQYLKVRRSNDILSRGLVRQQTEPVTYDMDRFKDDTWSELLHRRKERQMQKDRTKIRKIYDGPRDKADSIIENPLQDERIMRIIGQIKTDYPPAVKWSWAFFMREVDRINGYTYTTEANHMVDINTVLTCLEQLHADIKSGMPIQNHVEGGRTFNDRYALACLSDDEIDVYWEIYSQMDLYDSKDQFKQAVLDNARKCLDQVKGITDNKSKKRALLMAYDMDFRSHRIYNVSDYISNGLSLEDISVAQDRILAGLMRSEKATKGEEIYYIDPDVFTSLSRKEEQALVDLRRKFEATNISRAKFELTRNGENQAVVKIRAQDGQVVKAVLNSATEVSKVMALLNPLVFEANLLDRGVHQGIMRFAIWLGNSFHIGPYSSENVPAAGAIEMALSSDLFLEMYSAFRMAQLTGEDLEFLAHAKTVEEIQAWKADRRSKMTLGQKFASKVYDIQTGSNKMVKGQARNMLYRFAQFAEANPEQAFWFQKDGSGQTLFESMISDNDGDGAAKWFVECLGKDGKTPSFTILMQAINSAQQGDMAQRNTLAMVLDEVCRTSPLAKFIVTTTISRFPAYSLNVTNRMLNWVLPMSSIYYVFTERMAEHGHNKAAKAAAAGTPDAYVDPHYELGQVHRNLKEAMYVDITHLGVAAVAVILVGMSGGIEPPDDEKKWGNTDEWLVCGMRVGSAWWIQDVLGLALPLAAFTKSAQLGKPRMDILINGITDVCCSNPIIKVADAVGFISDPDGSLTAEYDREYDQYQDAKGGSPGFLDWIYGKGIGFGINWVSQFITPSFVRELYQNSQQWERSYKRVYQTNPDGSLSEAGQQGYTEKTTFIDAQIRRATRRNPMLGFLADIILHPTTGYMAGEMPITIYTDDYQREASEYWSINGLDASAQQAKILEIICEMQKYDDMNDLKATGFFLDNETRAALGSTVWDIIHEFDNWYYGLQSDGMLDYYALGNGDFNAGQQMAGSIKQEWLNQKNAWKNFYYDKVQALPTSMTKYNRYNTTYERDVYGNVYATGYRPGTFSPIVSAPGTTTNPEGTAGYENDFMTPSAVTGLPLGQRALIPTESYGEMMPSLEAFSGDGNGNGYSQLYQNWYGSDGTTGESGTLSSSLANTGLPGSNTGTPTAKSSTPQASGGSKKSSRSSGGGGRYRRRSGGGGGGGGYSSSPSIYARYQSPYAVTANVMGRTQHSRANFDYLRPGFETKGSRESYKREDI